MSKVFIAKQKILNKSGQLYAHELLFRDNANGITNFPTNLKATAHVLMHSLTNLNLDELLGKNGVAFINVDETVLTSGMLDVLDKDRFTLELLETIDLTDKVLSKIKQYYKRGFTIAIDDFDCSAEMIKKFTPVFKYIKIIKMDVLVAEPHNLKNVMNKLKSTGKLLLAEKVETQAEYNEYVKMGFDLFQGYHLHKPEVIEVDRYKEAAKLTILQLIKIIKEDGDSSEIEKYIKQQADLSYKLITFLNNHSIVEHKIDSIIQVITLLGRDKLLRWLLIYLYSEASNNPASETILTLAQKRAEAMEEEARLQDKDKAYISGMFSMLDSLFETNIKDVMKNINMDKEITQLVVEKKGKFATSLRKAEEVERDYLKGLICNNFDKINVTDIIYSLEFAGIGIDKNKL